MLTTISLLTDLIAHTHPLDVLPLIKIKATDTVVEMYAMAEKRNLILTAKTNEPIPEIIGEFGLSNISTLDFHLKCPEYKTNASITLLREQRDESMIPVGLYFSNQTKDYTNEYRFMNSAIIDKKMRTHSFKGARYTIELVPSLLSIDRMKLQSAGNRDESYVQLYTENNNLYMSFGEAASHTGKFIFAQNIYQELAQKHKWPKSILLGVLTLPGALNMKISPDGLLEITVATSIATYTYILLAS
jgi:hypothetical protein